MNPWTIRGAIAGALVALGIAIGWGLWHPRAPVVETAAAAVKQKDGSVVLARRPDTVVKIVHQLPPKSEPVRQVEIAVQGEPVIVHDTVHVTAADVDKNGGFLSAPTPFFVHRCASR